VENEQRREPGAARFADLDFESFRRMACDPSLSAAEKIGFPDDYRAGHEARILADVMAKLPALGLKGSRVLDIGPGVGELARRLIGHCGALEQHLTLVDSDEVLQNLPAAPHVVKRAGRFPRECLEWLPESRESIDALLVYSVFHYIFTEGNVFDFLDRALALLAPGGAMLIGDIPNVSMRKRFFASAAGVEFHRRFTGRSEDPTVAFNCVEPGKLDDAVVLAVLARCRAAGFDAYVLPQHPSLPLANRREDVLVRKP
jgi:cyclopropane fatty-acyl-phospholipid synthase-like methyltransferase